MRRIIGLFTLAVLISSLSSCAYRPIEPSAEETSVVGSVGEHEVYLDELRFVAYTYRELMTSRYGEGIFEGADKQKYLDMLREQVYANITANYATLELCEEAMIKLGEQRIGERVDEYMTEFVSELGGMSKYKRYLKENHATDHFIRFSIEVELLRNELMYVYIDDLSLIESDDERIMEIIEDDFIVVQHVFVSHSTEGAKDKIESAAARLEAGEEFTAVMKDLGEDTEMTEDGLFILEGYMTDDYEDVAFDLGVGEVSGVVTDELGYYLIKRIKMQTPAIWLNFQHLKNLYQTYTFYSMIDERQEALTFSPNETGESFMRDPFN